jgi:hypothetical protein
MKFRPPAYTRGGLNFLSPYRFVVELSMVRRSFGHTLDFFKMRSFFCEQSHF